MIAMQNRDIISIVRKTLNLVDHRLVDHGERVAYIVCKMLQCQGTCSDYLIQRICFLAMMHDIGAYKTEEIDNIVEFETKSVWDHSVYGYLFINNFSPLSDLAEAVLYHHLDYDKILDLDCTHKEIAMMISLADRLDIYLKNTGYQFDESLSKSFPPKKFSAELFELFLLANEQFDIVTRIANGSYLEELIDFVAHYDFTPAEVDRYLKLLVYVIDFRSEATVTHTILTVGISMQIAKRINLTEPQKNAVYYGALLHDLGKISTPIQILENPGKLTRPEMEIMKHHVVVTEEILKDYIDPVICKIAVRHHEKMDGSGYPRGLTAQDLTLSERAVAVADIMSALCGKRSYKDSFSKEKTIEILTKMARDNKICNEIVQVVVENFDDILYNANKDYEHVFEAYRSLKSSYINLYKRCIEI
ncbi:putative nucleotidyltransferase with HDIG domain [Hydrogenoanaerobacterium saccharovorans]|uniref:HDIG domain-containing protein n=1 Tax=Hydrogenoanaerobacterium saccharovorans TaxID=474960 RepID=A0A1H7Z6Y3_9FIRM|nr:HD domain-containing phosphohydrolase [Hydrogenoanaerobacterium saccharovorans]RPF48796.1 putative nucleotidyltransferase with HDIG domain [Hydrogenoanaerobacterium saccharovorans]SEM54045.1 HDIG domain-containing protein [Hydrogenoanaerobacterium saccharovorans]